MNTNPAFVRRTKVRAVLLAAQAWAEFQDDDSLKDQKDDPRLREAANMARVQLLWAIQQLPSREQWEWELISGGSKQDPLGEALNSGDGSYRP
jgi:hypothetical protein